MKLVATVAVAAMAIAAAAPAAAVCPAGGGIYWQSRQWAAAGGASPAPAPTVEATTEAYEAFFFTLPEPDEDKWCTRTDVTSWSGLRNQNLCPSGSQSNFGFIINFDFTAPSTGTYGFRFGADMGGGGFLRVDDTVLEADLHMDLWYNGNWGADHETLSGYIDLEAGTSHTLTILGFEGCCDGPQALEFNIDGGEWGTVDCDGLGTIPDAPIAVETFYCDGQGDSCASASVSSSGDSNTVTMLWTSVGSCD